MSIEYPEARILAKQLDDTIKGKKVESYDLRDCEKLHRIGFINRDLDDFRQLVGRRVEGVLSSGNTIRVRLDKALNLLLALEYGGVVLYHGEDVEAKHHLAVTFEDRASLTIRLTSMGLIFVVRDEQLSSHYMYRRDYMGAPNPLDVSPEWFNNLVASRNTQLKPVLVGKDAVVTGLSNSAFQDIIWRAGIHPKRRASELTQEQVAALYPAMKGLVEERLLMGGKNEFVDLFGRSGSYAPEMGPNMKGARCPRCGSVVEKIAHGGGQIHLCPSCQR